MAKPVSEAIADAVALWAERCWLATYNRSVELLSRPQSSVGPWTGTGPMLRTQTGHLKRGLRSASSFSRTFFRLAVGVSYGVAWHGVVSGQYPNWSITPTKRKAYSVTVTRRSRSGNRPGAMRWFDSSGRAVFRRRVNFKAGEFRPARPFIAQPMMELNDFYNDTLRKSLREKLLDSFPDMKVSVEFKI